MRVLTVRQPWAWAIIHAGKTVENRSRSLGSYTGPVAIHVALRDDDDWDERDASAFIGVCPFGDAPTHNRYGCVWCRDIAPRTWKNHGHIIGVVDLVETHHSDDCTGFGEMVGGCSPWAEAEGHHLTLANPRPLDVPVPWKGGLGLRKSELGVEGDWLVEWHEPCKNPCAGPEYGCPPACWMDPVGRLEAIA